MPWVVDRPALVSRADRLGLEHDVHLAGAVHANRQKLLDVAASARAGHDRERARRDLRMLALVRSGSFPYDPVVMSWLSRQLDKPSQKISPKDVKTLLT